MGIDLKQQPTSITILDWVSLYDTNQRGNYALEFLTAATEDTIDIPNAEQYQLPPDIKGKDLDETIEELVISGSKGLSDDETRERIRGRKKGIRKVWENGIRPWAIKTLDELRETENAEFRLDLLRPRLYDGTISEGNSISYAVDILPNLVYLFTSVLISGCSSDNKGNHKWVAQIWPSKRLPKIELERKIRGGYTEQGKGVGLKKQYANLLQLLGMPQGKIVDLTYRQLGVRFIEDLAAWTEEGELSKEDNRHAMKCLYRFLEAFIDHRYAVYTLQAGRNGKCYTSRCAQITMPMFRNKGTRDEFISLFTRIWGLINPDFDINPSFSEASNGAYQSKICIRKEYVKDLESRFPA